MSYIVHIGLEIHCELKTKTKMFSTTPVKEDAPVNMCVSPYDLGLPGTLPILNKEAVELAIRACHAFHCSIDPYLRFDRKNYFYPDLPKGFQITQAFHPIGKDGYLMVLDQKVPIERIHIEEDTAKMRHLENCSLLDFNRCGVPLIEIVTKPEIHSVDVACAFMEQVIRTVTYLEISEGKMEKANLRCDVNVSLCKEGEALGTKIEIKNLNSISNMRKGLKDEIERQKMLLDSGRSIQAQTRRFDEKSNHTIFLRAKESMVDYRYLPEPNLPIVVLSKEWIQQCIDRMPSSFEDRMDMLIYEHGQNKQESEVLLSQKEIADLYFSTISYTHYYTDVLHLLCTDVMAWKKEHQQPIQLEPKELALWIERMHQDLPLALFRKWLPNLLSGHSIEARWKEYRFSRLSLSSLESLITQVLSKNEKSIQDYQSGKDRALGYLVGQVMKEAKGKADPREVNSLIRKQLTLKK